MNMEEIKVIYASMSGRNQHLAEYVNNFLTTKGYPVINEGISQSGAFTWADYKKVILISYTYHDGDLPDEALDFYDDLNDVDLTGVEFALIGSSSTTHEHFGRALDRYFKRLTAKQATVIAAPVKIDRDPQATDYQRIDALLNALLAD